VHCSFSVKERKKEKETKKEKKKKRKKEIFFKLKN
jgi:hypothetical protein